MLKFNQFTDLSEGVKTPHFDRYLQGAERGFVHGVIHNRTGDDSSNYKDDKNAVRKRETREFMASSHYQEVKNTKGSGPAADAIGKAHGNWKQSGGGKLTKEDLDQMSSEEINELIENVEQLDEISKETLSSYIKKATSSNAAKARVLNKQDAVIRSHGMHGWDDQAQKASEIIGKHLRPFHKRRKGIELAKAKLTKEDLDAMGDDEFLALCEDCEQLDELSKKTLGSYAKAALDDYGWAQKQRGAAMARGDHDSMVDASKDSAKRKKGLNLAVKKLAKEDHNPFRGEQLDELSKQTLGSYIKKAANQISFDGHDHGAASIRAVHAPRDSKESQDATHDADAAHKKVVKRQTGIRRAVSRLTKEDLDQMSSEEINELVENVEQLDEISKKTLASYINKAHQSSDMHKFQRAGYRKGYDHGYGSEEGNEEARQRARGYHTKVIDKRQAGIKLAKKKFLAKEDFNPFRSEELDEAAGKDIGGGFRHVPYEKATEGPITSTSLSKEQMKKHGIPSHSREGEYGRTVQIHHPVHGEFHVYQRDYDERRKEHNVSVRPIGPRSKDSAEHLARHLSGGKIEESFDGLEEFIEENFDFKIAGELTEQQLDEISGKLAARYVKKALNQGEYQIGKGTVGISNKRDTGIYRATNRIVRDKSSASLRGTVKKLGNESPMSRKSNHNPYMYDAAREELRDNRGEHHFAGRVNRVGTVKDVNARKHGDMSETKKLEGKE